MHVCIDTAEVHYGGGVTAPCVAQRLSNNRVVQSTWNMTFHEFQRLLESQIIHVVFPKSFSKGVQSGHSLVVPGYSTTSTLKLATLTRHASKSHLTVREDMKPSIFCVQSAFRMGGMQKRCVLLARTVQKHASQPRRRHIGDITKLSSVKRAASVYAVVKKATFNTVCWVWHDLVTLACEVI